VQKNLKTKQLPLFPIVDLDRLRGENHLEDAAVTDFSVGRDGNVYLLLEQPSGRQSEDWFRTPAVYTVVEIRVDWTEQRVQETNLFPLGLLKFQFHFLRPIGEHFLLLGARSAWRENGPYQNAWVISRDGAILSRFCLGDGIQNCMVKADGTIITGYFDEGIFGSNGWEEPLGASGLVAWTPAGIPLWKNETYPIYDCYAISLDEEDQLWFYYYDAFRLVRTDFREDLVLDVSMEGSEEFAVSASGNQFLFQSGFRERSKFYCFTRQGGRLGQKQEAVPMFHASRIGVERCSLSGSRMLFLGEDAVLYGGVLGTEQG